MYSEMEKRHFIHNSIAMYDRKYLSKNPFDEHLPGKDRYWANDVVKKNHFFTIQIWRQITIILKRQHWKRVLDNSFQSC